MDHLNNHLTHIGIIGASILLTTYLTRTYRLGRKCKCTRRYYVEDVVIVTGSDSGIGLETAFLVAQKGARVILANADQEASRLAKVQIMSRLSPKSADIVPIQCDFASFKSIRKFVLYVQEYLKKRPGCRITALVNAEEFYPTKREITVDGFEKTFQINYLSPFLLINLLLPTMSKNKERRVVCLSSSVIDSCEELDLNELKQYVGLQGAYFQTNRAYQISKLCMALYTCSLTRRSLETQKYDLWRHAYSVDPGIIESGTFYNSFSFLPQKIKRFLVKTMNEGCQGIMHALLVPPSYSFYIKDIDYIDKYLTVLFLEEALQNKLYKKTCKWTNALDHVDLEAKINLTSLTAPASSSDDEDDDSPGSSTVTSAATQTTTANSDRENLNRPGSSTSTSNATQTTPAKSKRKDLNRPETSTSTQTTTFNFNREDLNRTETSKPRLSASKSSLQS